MSSPSPKKFVIPPQSSEEEFIAEYFKKSEIKYDSEVPINNLKNDTKKYRRADFLLPNLKVYVEYYGHYNATKERRDEYDLKSKVYVENNIPTVFLYPHELGFLDYAFNKKITKVLKLSKFDLKWQLFKYRLNRFDKKTSNHFGTLLISLAIIFVVLSGDLKLSGELEPFIFFVCIIVAVIYSYKVFKDIRNYFFRDY
jgi:hypothetical protein